jgi:hypothetical protein
MKETHIFIFYMALIVVIALISRHFSNPENGMMNSLYGSAVGVGMSFYLWLNYGQYSVDK